MIANRSRSAEDLRIKECLSNAAQVRRLLVFARAHLQPQMQSEPSFWL